MEVDDEGINHFFLLSFSSFFLVLCLAGRRKEEVGFGLLAEVSFGGGGGGSENGCCRKDGKVSEKEEERKEVTFPTRVILVPQGEVSALDVFSSQGT